MIHNSCSFSVNNLYMSRYEIGLCQKFNTVIHGFDIHSSSPEIKDHYICLYTIDFDFSTYSNGLFASSQVLSKFYNATIEIIEPITLYPGEEMVAIYKTFWLRIFQRICRKWLIQRKFSCSTNMYAFLLKREYCPVIRIPL